MNFKEFKNKALQNATFRREYEKHDVAFEIGQMIVEARILKGLTQQQLAKLVNTKQPSIARLENGQQLPSLSFLEKIAKALKTQLLTPKFAFFAQEPTSVNITVNLLVIKPSDQQVSPVAISTNYNSASTYDLTKNLTPLFA